MKQAGKNGAEHEWEKSLYKGHNALAKRIEENAGSPVTESNNAGGISHYLFLLKSDHVDSLIS